MHPAHRYRQPAFARAPRSAQPASDPATWRPVPDRLRTPDGGVTLAPGSRFDRAVADNAEYLLASPSDRLLYHFRQRAGISDPPGADGIDPFWDGRLPGSSAGRFLMGAAGTLRFREHPVLRQRLHEVVAGIAACVGTDRGLPYHLPFPPEDLIAWRHQPSWLEDQQGAYARAWLVHGLLEGWRAGEAGAGSIARAIGDWFNGCPDLPRVLGILSGYQGAIASTRLALTPMGRTDDIEVIERWGLDRPWLERLAAGEPDAIWRNPESHCYLLTAVEAACDLWRSTGNPLYRDATLGAWNLYRDHWLHHGGALAICEFDKYPPDSRYLQPAKHTGETCGSVFWTYLNQRLHRIFSDDVRFVDEIERSILNVVLAAQGGSRGIRYHNHLMGTKEVPSMVNTCCAGQGTRLLAALPEFIYAIDDAGVTVDLFAPSTIAWNGLVLEQRTAFPADGRVELRISCPRPTPMRLRVRVPGWCAGAVEIDGVLAAPGTFTVIERTWNDGDRIAFTLPMTLRCERYQGHDQHSFGERHALFWGPVLLAVTGSIDGLPGSVLYHDPARIGEWLTPCGPLRWRIPDEPERLVMPYADVDAEPFTCFPILSP